MPKPARSRSCKWRARRYESIDRSTSASLVDRAIPVVKVFLPPFTDSNIRSSDFCRSGFGLAGRFADHLLRDWFTGEGEVAAYIKALVIVEDVALRNAVSDLDQADSRYLQSQLTA